MEVVFLTASAWALTDTYCLTEFAVNCQQVLSDIGNQKKRLWGLQVARVFQKEEFL